MMNQKIDNVEIIEPPVPIINDNPVCCSCGSTIDLEYGPDPYAIDIYGDDTPVWECSA